MKKRAIVLLWAGIFVVSACAGPGGKTSGALLEEKFSGSEQTWTTGTDADSSVEYAGGGLHMQVFTPNYFVWSMANAVDYSNIHIEVTVKNDGMDGDAAFGLICHQGASESDQYYLAITSNGQYAIAREAAGQDDVYLTGGDYDYWGVSDLIPANASSYQLGADCGNGTLALYVNGQQIAFASDSTYTSGKVGLFAWSAEMTAPVDLTFNDFIVTPLK
ncbi:MAG TPA: hypothetical protein PKL78_12775 [Anaerolineales bacterium]|nr:hypothetical protein [Anaerolineales bacterium]HUM28365.1 hypothetical protein [Anaerolineales bacterium]